MPGVNGTALGMLGSTPVVTVVVAMQRAVAANARDASGVASSRPFVDERERGHEARAPYAQRMEGREHQRSSSRAGFVLPASRSNAVGARSQGGNLSEEAKPANRCAVASRLEQLAAQIVPELADLSIDERAMWLRGYLQTEIQQRLRYGMPTSETVYQPPNRPLGERETGDAKDRPGHRPLRRSSRRPFLGKILTVRAV